MTLPVCLAPECDGGHGEGLHSGGTPAVGWQPGRGQEQDHRPIPATSEQTQRVYPASQVGTPWNRWGREDAMCHVTVVNSLFLCCFCCWLGLGLEEKEDLGKKKCWTIFLERLREGLYHSNIRSVWKATLGKIRRDRMECIYMGFCEHVNTTLNRTKHFGLVYIYIYFCGLVAISLKIMVPVYNCYLPENNSISLQLLSPWK